MLPIAKILILVGIFLVLSGIMIILLVKAGLPLGRLPGDIIFQSGNSSCVIALGTSIVLSVLLTLVINLLVKILSK